MKTEPTEVDREAARLFAPAPGMRMAWLAESGRWNWERVPDWVGTLGGTWYGMPLDCLAIDTDDDATSGAMVGQLAAVAPGYAVSVIDRRDVLPWDAERRFAVLAECDGTQVLKSGMTRSAALVAAMRALKGATPPG